MMTTITKTQILKQDIQQVLKSFIMNHPKEFEPCLKAMKDLMREFFPALQPESNPFAQSLSRMSDEQLCFVIQEYSGFSNEAIHFLLDTMLRNHNWKKLYEEIQENIEEEKGKETKGIPHLEMMRHGYWNDLGIRTDEIEYSAVTQSFLKKMQRVFKHADNAFSAGALLALEGTAVAEFHILDKLVKEYDLRKGTGNVTSPSVVTLTNLYVDGHKDFEIEHEAHLRKAIQPYIHSGNISHLVKGYFTVCMHMNIWWEQLFLESCWLQSEELLKVEATEVFQVGSVFFNSDN